MLVYKGKAEVIERLDKPLRSAIDSFIWPHVIRLVHYVRVPRAIQRKISRRALFARDGWKCVYCGTTAGRLTLDHIIPRSKGGESIWENVVTACAPCNLRKGDRLARAGRDAAAAPAAPARAGALHPPRGAADPAGWAQYLPGRRPRRSVAVTCDVCGETHDGDTRHVRMSLPDPILRIDEREREERAWVGEAAAVLRDDDRERFFVRALLELPIDGEDGLLRATAAGSRSAPRTSRCSRALARRGRLAEPPILRHARQRAPPLRVHGGPAGAARLREVRVLPHVELDETDHELVRAQRNGISPIGRTSSPRTLSPRSTGPSAYHSLNEPG